MKLELNDTSCNYVGTYKSIDEVEIEQAYILKLSHFIQTLYIDRVDNLKSPCVNLLFRGVVWNKSDGKAVVINRGQRRKAVDKTNGLVVFLYVSAIVEQQVKNSVFQDVRLINRRRTQTFDNIISIFNCIHIFIVFWLIIVVSVLVGHREPFTGFSDRYTQRNIQSSSRP
nr:MAG TPA: hypothetical protein [Caudoviricetes sp.]